MEQRGVEQALCSAPAALEKVACSMERSIDSRSRWFAPYYYIIQYIVIYMYSNILIITNADALILYKASIKVALKFIIKDEVILIVILIFFSIGILKITHLLP